MSMTTVSGDVVDNLAFPMDFTLENFKKYREGCGWVDSFFADDGTSVELNSFLREHRALTLRSIDVASLKPFVEGRDVCKVLAP